MLVRSSSTPVLGALLVPAAAGAQSPAAVLHFADSSPTVAYHHPPAISCHLFGDGGGGSAEQCVGGGLRRTCSDGNLVALGGRAEDGHGYHHLPLSGKGAPRSKQPATALETIPSSFTSRDGSKDEEEEEEEDDADGELEEEMSFGRFGLSSGSTFSQESPLFLARGLGIDRLGSGLFSADGSGGIDGGGGGGGYLVTSGNGGYSSGIEIHYNKLIEEDPSNGLFLKNYAQFLYQVKGDYRRAEEYYSRAILVDPTDGELLSEYAQLVWAVHRDQERASSYFEQAAMASPENSHVLAAQAAFLWDTDDGAGPEGSGVGVLSYTGFAAARSSMASSTI